MPAPSGVVIIAFNPPHSHPMPPTPPFSPGSLLIAAGVVLILIGLLVSSGGFGWFGRLPGDIRIEREHVRIYIPLVSMLVVSLVLTLLARLFHR
jgi:hypothetical protein